MVLGAIYSEEYLKLDFGLGHPFQASRFERTIELFREYLAFELLRPRRISPRILVELGVHSEEYIDLVRRCSELEIPYLSEYSADTPCFRGMLDWALAYCGGAIEGCEALLRNRVKVAFNIAGGFHHAKYDSDGGFCVFNDCALAVAYLWQRGVKVLYLDVDAHAGDGTYMILYRKPIIKISIHESPYFLYPGCGFVEEVGEGAGYGYTVNIPLPPGSGDTEFLAALNEIVLPIIKVYDPDVIVLQAGVDGYFKDPLTHLNYTHHSYVKLAEALHKLNKKILVCPGGGYSKQAPILHTIIAGILSGQKDRIQDLIQNLRREVPKTQENKTNLAQSLIKQIKQSHPIWKALGKEP